MPNPLDFETSSTFLRFMSESPLFKGTALIILSAAALLFAGRSVKSGKKKDMPVIVFISLSILILLYGLFILVFQPHWWDPLV